MPIDCSDLTGIDNNPEFVNYIKTIEFGETV
jgi:hypothetical protein